MAILPNIEGDMTQEPASEGGASFDALVADHRTDLKTMRVRGMSLLEALADAINAGEGRKALAPQDAAARFGTLVLGLTRIIEKERQSFAPVQNLSAMQTGEDQEQTDESELDQRIADELDRIAQRRGTR